jgi:peptidoglycan hydrolase CwlO-like protein
MQIEKIKKLETENAKLKAEIHKLVVEIAIANKFIKSQKEYYENLTNKNPNK